MLVLVSWLDAGTIDGAIRRFRHFSNPQKLVIMASNHGGGSHASPFVVGDEPVSPVPSTQEQFKMRLDFFDHYLKGVENGVDDWPAIRYYNLGEEAFHSTDVWPVEGWYPQRMYFGADGGLSDEAPESEEGADTYEVDFSVTTGATNRWTTQMGGPVAGLDDRAAMDNRMLAYTSEPLEEDLQITGAPVVTLWVTPDHADGSFFVYLEDVDENGRSRYVTEGGLRAIHRRLWNDPVYGEDGPLHSFEAADRMPMVPGEITELRFKLWATSASFLEGHRIRVAIAGADADTFDRMPAEGDSSITVHRSATHSSFIELPVVVPASE
jgi:putative CocE/NonD family hydrolase